MRRDPLTRFGCDHCKLDPSTYGFTHYDEVKVWICDVCLRELLEWDGRDVRATKETP